MIIDHRDKFRERMLVEDRVFDETSDRHKDHNIRRSCKIFKQTEWRFNKKYIEDVQLADDYMIWSGDIDFDLDENKLISISKEIKSKLYITDCSCNLICTVNNKELKIIE